MKLLLLSLMMIFTAKTAVAANQWAVVPGESSLTFEAVQAGTVFEGRFGRFDAEIRFSEQDLASSYVRAVVDITSIDAGAAERNQALPTKPWFDAGAFPQAIFESSDFRRSAAGRYEAVGMLTIKGVSQPATLPFSLKTDGETAHMIGFLKVVRDDFNVGTGEWASDTWIGLDVQVSVDIVARKRPDDQRNDGSDTSNQ